MATKRKTFSRDNVGLEWKYFVMKPAGKSPYAEASRRALDTYAASIFTVNPTLANEIRAWVKKELNGGK